MRDGPRLGSKRLITRDEVEVHDVLARFRRKLWIAGLQVVALSQSLVEQFLVGRTPVVARVLLHDRFAKDGADPRNAHHRKRAGNG
jgi:hypothetical protein